MASAYGSSTFARPPGMPGGPHYQYHSPDGTSKWKGPRRVCIFCSTAIILPSLLISLPLLMRFVIYGSSSYLLHPSDMRILDQRISTTWCEAETVTMNTTFTAYVTKGEPNVFGNQSPLVFEEPMSIPDDQKEYWGFYLLPGSSFKIKACAKHKGATLLIVRGNNHMQYCAYIGEGDSAGNSDEVSGSASFELRNKHGNGSNTQPKGQEDITILTRLKAFLQTHPKTRSQIQRTLEDWMLINSTTEAETTTAQPATFPTGNHGTVRRRRQAVDVLPDTESGENSAIEDTSPDVAPPKNASVLDLLTPRQSIWKQEHNQHSGTLNSSFMDNDGSISESESSFSSSEEALAKCEGVIVTYKIPNEPDECKEGGTFDSLKLSKMIPELGANEYSFDVTERDYYYFIFGSENERETNYVRAKFELKKTAYELPEPIKDCKNVKECQVPFGFASSDKVVVQLPMPSKDANSNVVFLGETFCKPRSHLYLIFVILVPVVILMFAFK